LRSWAVRLKREARTRRESTSDVRREPAAGPSGQYEHMRYRPGDDLSVRVQPRKRRWGRVSGNVDGMCGEEYGRLLDTDFLRNRPHSRAEPLHCLFGLENVEDAEAVRAFPSCMK
jgi:hypothetical protein